MQLWRVSSESGRNAANRFSIQLLVSSWSGSGNVRGSHLRDSLMPSERLLMKATSRVVEGNWGYFSKSERISAQAMR
jgi:hypothetical protein